MARHVIGGIVHKDFCNSLIGANTKDVLLLSYSVLCTFSFFVQKAVLMNYHLGQRRKPGVSVRNSSLSGRGSALYVA